MTLGNHAAMTPHPTPSLDTLGSATRLAQRLHVFVSLGALAGLVAILSSPWWMSAEWLRALASFQWRVAAPHLPATLPPDSLWGTRLAVLLPGLFGLMAMHRLRQLLAHYMRGTLFDLQAAQLLRSTGLWLTGMGAMQVLSPTLGLLALTLHNPPGHRLLSVGMSFENYTVLLLGTLIVLLASVMVEATRIAQENQEFV